MMQSRSAAAVTAMVAAALLSGCSAPGPGPASSYPDGVYTGRSQPDGDGATGEITFTLSGGQVGDVRFVITDADGTPRDESYGTGSDGEIVDQEFYRRAQNAIRAETEYITRFEEASDQAAVEAIAGASLSHRHFVQAIEDALAGAEASG